MQRLFLTRTSYLSKTRLQSAAAQLKPRFAAQNGLPPRERSLLTPLFFFFGVGGGGGVFGGGSGVGVGGCRVSSFQESQGLPS